MFANKVNVRKRQAVYILSGELRRNFVSRPFREQSKNIRFCNQNKKNTAYYSGRLETIFQPVCTSTQLASLFVCVCDNHYRLFCVWLLGWLWFFCLILSSYCCRCVCACPRGDTEQEIEWRSFAPLPECICARARFSFIYSNWRPTTRLFVNKTKTSTQNKNQNDFHLVLVILHTGWRRCRLVASCRERALTAVLHYFG